jgi:hypothetical protein
MCNACGEMSASNCDLQSAFESGVSSQVCKDNRASKVCQRAECGGSGNSVSNTPGAGDCGSGSCFGKATGAQRGGLGDLFGLSKDTQGEGSRMRDAQAGSIDNANNILGRWDRSLATGNSKGGARSDWIRDQALVEKATRSYQGKGDFSPEDAASAHDPGVKRELSTYSQTHSLETGLAWQETQTQRQLQALTRMNEETNIRLGSMQSMVVNASTSASGHSEVSANRSASSSKTGARALSPFHETNNPTSTFPQDTERKSGFLLPPSLRDQLRKKLAEAGKGVNSEALEGKSFQGTLASTGLEGKESNAEGGLGDIVGQAVRSRAITLSDTESAREVNRLLASQGAGGALDKESTDLFQRVRRAHRSCEQRACVVNR